MWARPNLLKLGVLLSLITTFTPPARANVTVLLEEPYSYDGALAGTGHTAVYLTRVCAATPVMLRRCRPEEHGAVISRYTHIAGYDWIAIPLVPYLYAVESPDDIPLYADPRLVAFLRDQYRRAHLEELAPDKPGGETPKGDWYELVGSSYDRTNYGFEIETTEDQDDAFIAYLNSRPNDADYQFIRRNCADFVREVLNFYYPHSESRATIADLFVSTPKHAAKSLVRYGKKHPELELTRFVIPQVSGSVRRSRPVRGVLESVFRSKKYVVALAVIHPFVAGGLVSANLVGDRFHPARDTAVFNLGGPLEAPPGSEERRAYLQKLRTISASVTGYSGDPALMEWNSFAEKSHPALDGDGSTVLQASNGSETFEVGVTRQDLQSNEAPLGLQKGLLISRMKQTLQSGRAPRISSAELHADWLLLKKIDEAEQASLIH